MLKRWRIRILLFLAVLGPGFITANVDNDSGGILTYSQAGAQYGYTLLWTMIPITIALIVVQEMCARMGVVTGKGLSDLIREEFGLRLTFVLMVLLVVVNYTNVVTEFIGIAGSLHLFHVSKFISVPFCAALVWYMVVRAATRARKRSSSSPRLVTSAYIFAGVLSQPSWHDALLATVKLPPARSGATRPISTWPSAWSAPPSRRGCSSICNRRSWKRAFASRTTRLAAGRDRGQPLHRHCGLVHHRGLRGHALRAWHGRHPGGLDAAEAMRPLAGDYAFILFAFGLFNASLFAASILPLSTAYTVCEGLGVESGVDKSFKEAPFFYWLYTLLIAGGALTVLLLPDAQLINVAILSQVLNGVLLPVVIILMLMLINRKDLMGEHKNSRLWNVIAWGTSIIVIGMTLVMLWGMMPGH
jgi:Mn2+/Fe2+ NRAMP family transporter